MVFSFSFYLLICVRWPLSWPLLNLTCFLPLYPLCDSLLPSLHVLFHLVSEVKSCQRAYFYHRFPILHSDSGDDFFSFLPPAVCRTLLIFHQCSPTKGNCILIQKPQPLTPHFWSCLILSLTAVCAAIQPGHRFTGCSVYWTLLFFLLCNSVVCGLLMLVLGTTAKGIYFCMGLLLICSVFVYMPTATLLTTSPSWHACKLNWTVAQPQRVNVWPALYHLLRFWCAIRPCFTVCLRLHPPSWFLAASIFTQLSVTVVPPHHHHSTGPTVSCYLASICFPKNSGEAIVIHTSLWHAFGLSLPGLNIQIPEMEATVLLPLTHFFSFSPSPNHCSGAYCRPGQSVWDVRDARGV